MIPSPNIGVHDDRLAAVGVAGPNNVWAVGHYFLSYPPSTNLYFALIEHWDGAAWSIVPGANPSENFNDLAGITVVGPNDIWAVGSSELDGVTKTTLIEHWNGAAWSVVASPNVGTLSNILTGVSANFIL